MVAGVATVALVGVSLGGRLGLGPGGAGGAGQSQEVAAIPAGVEPDRLEAVGLPRVVATRPLDGAPPGLVPAARAAVDPLAAGAADPGAFAAGSAVDAARGRVHGLGGGLLSTFDYDPAQGSVGLLRHQVQLGDLVGPGAAGLAVDPANGAVYVGDLGAGRLLQLSAEGQPQRYVRLGGAVAQPQAFTVADDGGGRPALWVLDGSTAVALDLAPARPPVGPQVVDRVEVVRTVPLGQSSARPSPDSAGLTWDPATQRFLLVDSEIDEYRSYAGTNVWSIATDGEVTPQGTTLAWSNEPTGIAVGPAGTVFQSDDEVRAVHVIDVGPDGRFGTDDDRRVRSVDTMTLGGGTVADEDPEDVAYDPTRKRLYVLDGGRAEVYLVGAGPDGLIGAGGDDTVTSFDTAAMGIRDPEGVTYDQVNDSVLIVDYEDSMAVELGPEGAVLRQLDLGAAGLIHPAGVAWGPPVAGRERTLWVADRGVDGTSVSDGKLVELAVPALGGGAPAPEAAVPADLTLDGGGAGAALQLTIANPGSAPLTVAGVEVRGSAGVGAPFALTSPWAGPVTVPAGGSLVVPITLHPEAAGAAGGGSLFGAELGSIAVESNDPYRPRAVVAVRTRG